MNTLAKIPAPAWYIAAGAVLLYVVSTQLARGAKAAGQAINPVNPDNVFHRGANAVGAAVSGDSSFSLGSWLFDVTHPNEGK